MAGVFKAYDVRGIYPSELNEDIAYRTGKAYVKFLNAKKLIGIYTTESGIMIPEKSMCGIILTNYKFSCTGCFILQKCKYRKQGTTCYNQ